ncbi:hypothetical protein HOLleu_40186 [Holothuria leucospilota]|uniref:Uncharacterized protein n=1 Tax=Holothuria leucospilota TaxID=206669 RepID=A0A9Q0YHW9_HOLLE|nr:hypothetical protein HOLleu_40186 [Holothuria leucospilota]
MGAPAVCERSCGYGCTQQHVLDRTQYSRRELRSRTSFLGHAELETGVAARKFRRCNEKSRAAARACLGKQPALQARHAELETGVAARKFRRCNEKSRAAARACLGKQPALQTPHAELETGVAARKFRRCNEKSLADARACLGKQPALQHVRLLGWLEVSPA